MTQEHTLDTHPFQTRVRLCIRMRDPSVNLCRLLSHAYDQGCVLGSEFSPDLVQPETKSEIRAELEKLAKASGEDIPWAERKSAVDHVKKINQFFLMAAGHAWLECSTNEDHTQPPNSGSIWHWLPDSRRNANGGVAVPDANTMASAPAADKEWPFIDFLIEWFGWLRPPATGNRRKLHHEHYVLRINDSEDATMQVMRNPINFLMKLRHGGFTYISPPLERVRKLEDVVLTDLPHKYPDRYGYEMPPLSRHWENWRPQGFNCLSWAAELLELAVVSHDSDSEPFWKSLHADFIGASGPQNRLLSGDDFQTILRTGAINQLLQPRRMQKHS